MNKFLNKIIHGDCLEVMREIPDGTIDMVLCDLPYGTTACAWDTIIPFEPLWEQYERIIKENGAIVLTACQPFTSLLVTSNLKLFKYDWTWEKDPTAFLNAKRMPLKVKEDVLVFYKKQPTYNPQGVVEINRTIKNSKSKGERTEVGLSTHNGGRLKGVYFQKYTNYPKQILKFKSQRGIHPTQKPVPLFEYLIKTYTNKGETVLDNCIGSGTTAIACMNTGRNFIGIELEEKYVKIARNRIAQEEQKNNFRLFQASDVSRIEEEREKGLFE